MLIVTANSQDQIAQDLVSRWKPYEASLLTCADLSICGWRHRLYSPADATIVVGGQSVPVKEITGVYTRLPRVFVDELEYIAPDERSYVAEEMTAFLLCWLASLHCPVINRPTPTCLAGPYWRKGQWVYAAAQVGMRVCPFVQRATVTDTLEEVNPTQTVTVTVVNGRCFGDVAQELAEQARQLANFARVGLLAIQFSDPEPDACFVDANPWPELDSDEIEGAVLSFLQEEVRQ